MAILKFGALVSGVRGSIGGLVFSSSVGGPCVRSAYRPTNPRTLLQSGQRGTFSLFPELWRALSDAQKQDWIDYAAEPSQVLVNSLGEEYYASGFNWYNSINRANILAGRPVIASPPENPTPPVPPIDAVSVYESGGAPVVAIDWTPVPPPEDEYLVAFAAYSTGSARMVAHSGFYLLGSMDPPLASATSFGSSIIARWPAAAPGDTFFMRFFLQSSEGRRGAPFQSRCVYYTP